MLRFARLLILMVMLVVWIPAHAETAYSDKSLQTEDSLLSGDEMDWLREPIPSDSSRISQPAYPSLSLAQPVRGGVAVQQYSRPAASAVVGPNPGAGMLVPPQGAGYGAVQPTPVFAPGAVPARMVPMTPAAYYPIIIIQQQVPPSMNGTAQPQAQWQPASQASTPAQPQTLSQAVSQALAQAQGQAAGGGAQATKPGFRGFVDALMGAGTTMLPGGYAGAGFTLARPVLDLFLNSF